MLPFSRTTILSDSLSMINYEYDIGCKIDSDDFKTFLDNYSSGAISRLHSKIIIQI